MLPVQNFGKNTLAPRDFKSWITNCHKWRTLFRLKLKKCYRLKRFIYLNLSLCSTTCTEAPNKAHSMADRKPHGPKLFFLENKEMRISHPLQLSKFADVQLSTGIRNLGVRISCPAISKAFELSILGFFGG